MDYESSLCVTDSPAHHAVEHGDLAELTRLLDTGTDPNEVSGNMTLLLHAIDVEADGAAQTGAPLDAACTAVLLAYGADPELAGPDGEVPRLFAFHYGHGPAVRLLEAYIARVKREPVPDPCPPLLPAEPANRRATE
ncbi:ankyrin repeat domain-containing protein [Streptomyces sp. NPDC001661]